LRKNTYQGAVEGGTQPTPPVFAIMQSNALLLLPSLSRITFFGLLLVSLPVAVA